VPKRKHSSIQDRSQLVVNSHSNSSSGSSHTVNFGLSPDLAKRGRKDEKSSPVGICESSRDRSNPARVPKKTQGPANNRSIHDFFSSSHKKSHPTSGGTSPNEASSDGTNTKSDPSLASSIDLASDQIDWAAKCQKLEQLLQDKDEQLKAVTNNKTILHTALQSALEKTRQELDSVKKRMNDQQTATCAVLEDLLRWKSNQQAKDLRETLAADGARLGRIVYARAGMRALESWEEGYATKDLEHRKQALVAKREALEARSKEVEGEENPNTFEAMEVREAIRMHFENLRIQEAELSKEEQSLNDEKGAHIRALKRVASEDASRFRHRPKVCYHPVFLSDCRCIIYHSLTILFHLQLHDRYVLHCLLGKGGFSEVWRGYDLQELREVAVKIHQLDPRWPDSKKENYTKHVSREYEIHRNVRHPRIVSLYDVFEIDNNSFATVLECCKGTDLDALLKSKRRLPERQARALLLQILSGMNYLSQPSGSRQGIIHYDLKPGNILFDEFGDAKITDFGLSKIVDTQDSADSMELTSQGAGTYWYLPPECFITNERVRISNKVDVWSIGVIYYQMLYGSRPFGEGQTQDKLLSDHTMLNAHQVHFPDQPEISQEGKGFIRQCLMYDQAFRPTIAQLCEQPYVVNHKFEK
jgi:tousled-like kinase